MSGSQKPFAVSIPPGSYQTFSSTVSASLLRALRDPNVVERAASAIAEQSDNIRAAVLNHVERLERAAAAFDFEAVYAEAHEIRGLAGNAGLSASARIANGLCLYLDALSRSGGKVEASVVFLHSNAVARAAKATDEATRLGQEVAVELAALVEKRLAGIKD